MSYDEIVSQVIGIRGASEAALADRTLVMAALTQIAKIAREVEAAVEADRAKEAAMFEQMADRWEDAQDAKADAISAGWGWD